MWAYKPLPMSGTGYGIATDHLARSGVMGNGARLRWGTPASLATVDTATVGGVVDEPMIMSALDSVTKRRAFVVALVGSPPSSSTITLSGTPPISFGTNSSALRSGMPSAAAGAVVEIEMPMVISLVCAIAGNPGSATDAATTAADSKNLFIHSSRGCYCWSNQNSIGNSAPSLGDVARQVMLFTDLAPHEPGNDLLRHGRRFQPCGIVGVAADQHAGLERLDRQRLALEHPVGHLETRTLEAFDPALDGDPVAMGRGDIEFRPRVHHRDADQTIALDDVLLGEAGGLEQDRGRVVEHLEVARVIDDVGGVAVAPLDLDIPAVDEHGPSAAPCAARRRAAPLRRSDRDCRSCASPARRIRRHGRAGAGTGSPRRGCPAPPAADWPIAASGTGPAQ